MVINPIPFLPLLETAGERNPMKRIIPAAILTLVASLCFGQLAYAKETAQTPQPATGAATAQASPLNLASS
jgi:hypothetical protein